MKTGLVLSGGLFRAAFQVGVVEALHERGFRPDVVVGVSSGAWNGACLVAGQVRQMRDFWHAVADMPKIDLRAMRFNRTPFNLRTIVDEIPRAHLDFAAIGASPQELYVGATRLRDFTFRILDAGNAGPDDAFAMLMASNLIPGLYAWPVRLHSGYYIDGGFTNKTPYEAALQAGCRRIIVVTPDLRTADRLARISAAPSRLSRMTVIAPHRRLHRLSSRRAHINTAIDHGYEVGHTTPL